MTSKTKRYGYTALTISDDTAERFRALRDGGERKHSSDRLLTELLDRYKEEVS